MEKINVALTNKSEVKNKNTFVKNSQSSVKTAVVSIGEPPDGKGRIFLKIAKVSVYFLVFLLPIFFLPFTGNALEFQKQALLLFLILISLAGWLAGILTSNKLEINKSFVSIPVAVLVLSGILSTVFSTFRYGSFWGFSLPISSSLLTLLSFAVLYFIIINLFKKEEILFLFLTLFSSGFLAALIFIFHAFGAFIIPFDFAKKTSFNPVGTINSFAAYLTVLLILLAPVIFFVKRFFKILLGIFAAVFLFSLFLINFKTGWIVFLAGTAVLFALGAVSLKKTRNSAFITLLMTFLVIGIFFTFFKFSLPGAPAVPLEISPTHKTSFNILIQLSPKQLILGSGPGTFFYNWAKYKPAEINQTFFWQFRFFKPVSEIFNIIIGAGILGILAFFFLLAVCLKKVFFLLLKPLSSNPDLSLKERDAFNQITNRTTSEMDRFLLSCVISGFAAIILTFFLYSANLSILLIFWLLVSFTALLGLENKYKLDFQTSAVRALGASFGAVLILILGIGLAISYGQKYAAEVRYYQGLRAFQQGEIDQAEKFILQAAKFNPKLDTYWRDLSQIFLLQLREILARTDLSQEEITSNVQALVADAVNSAKQATVVDPQSVANWNILGFVYHNMIGILRGSEEWALSSYEKAKELEPRNPYIFTEVGRINLLKADLLAREKKTEERAESLSRAFENFERAIELKSDYAPAHFQIAMIHIRENRISQAIEQLEKTKLVAPFDTGLAFQLGLIYYNDNKLNQAKSEFERAVSIDPNYSNARYFLGLILDKQGQKQGAILQFERIQELNPDHEDVKRILVNLKAGKPALEGVVPGEPPIEEKPEEQLE